MSIWQASLIISRRLRRTALIQFRPCFLQNQFSRSRLLSSSTLDPKNSSLSDRMSFLFEQIEALERERVEKDHTLQRIREWHQFKGNSQASPSNENGETELHASEDARASSNQLGTMETKSNEFESRVANHPVSISRKLDEEKDEKNDTKLSATNDSTVSLDHFSQPANQGNGMVVEMAHPWPEWIELMERLVQQNYFDHIRKDEDSMVENLGLTVDDIGTSFCATDLGVNFNDIKSVQNACLNFGKDRFDILRSISKRDIQVLVGYGCPTTDRKVVFSAKFLRKYAHIDEGDVCSSCSMRGSCEKAFLLSLKEDEAKTVDLMRVLLAYGLDHSFHTVTNKSLAKHKVLRTVVRKILHEIVKLSSVPIDPNLPRPIVRKPPPKVKQPPPSAKKRVGRNDIDMKKGDWLCPKCDFMNFAKNTVCLQCDAKRPKRQLLPGEWECPQCNFLNYRRNMVCFHCECKRPQDDFIESMMEERQHVPGTSVSDKKIKRHDVSNAWNFDFDDDESDGADVAAFEYADSGPKSVPVLPQNDTDLIKGGKSVKLSDQMHDGFNDFDDDYDIDSYEVETKSKSSSSYSYVQMSDLEISEGSDSDDHTPTKSRTPSSKVPRRASRKDNSESDDDFSAEPKLRSSHVADTKYRKSGRMQDRVNFVSDEVELSSSEDDDVGFRSRNVRKPMSRRRSRNSDTEEESSFSGSDSDGEPQFQRDFKRKSGDGKSRVQYDSRRRPQREMEAKFRRPRREADGKNSWNDESSGFYTKRKSNFVKSDELQEGGRRGGPGSDVGTFRNSRRVIER